MKYNYELTVLYVVGGARLCWVRLWYIVNTGFA